MAQGAGAVKFGLWRGRVIREGGSVIERWSAVGAVEREVVLQSAAYSITSVSTRPGYRRFSFDVSTRILVHFVATALTPHPPGG